MADSAVPATPPPLLRAQTPPATPATASVAREVPQDRPTIAGYLLEDRLGAGGMGSVWRARQLSVGRAVALKLLDPQLARGPGFAERFMREARAAASITHAHVCTCFDAGCDDGRYYLALELIPGGDVTRLIAARGGRLPPAEAVQIARDCARGLEAVEAAGLIHRDIKPANIFLTADPAEGGIAKLGDFGLARPTGPNAQLTHTGAAVGTPAYMAPEQARGDRAIDIRADIYALGASLYEMLTGHPPFTGETAYAIVSQVLLGPTPDPRQQVRSITPALSAVVMRAMGRSPAERYASARALREDLDAVLAGQLPQAFQKSVGANLATGLLSRGPAARPGSPAPAAPAARPAPAPPVAPVDRVQLPLPVIVVGAGAVACTLLLLVWTHAGHRGAVPTPAAAFASPLPPSGAAAAAPTPAPVPVPVSVLAPSSSPSPAAAPDSVAFPARAVPPAPAVPTALTAPTARTAAPAPPTVPDGAPAAAGPSVAAAPARPLGSEGPLPPPSPAAPAPSVVVPTPVLPPPAGAPPPTQAPALPPPTGAAAATPALPPPPAAGAASTARAPALDALPRPSTVPGP